MKGLMTRVDQKKLNANGATCYMNINTSIDSINSTLTGLKSFSDISRQKTLEARRHILILSKQSDLMLKTFSSDAPVNNEWITEYNHHLSQVKTYTEYAPIWVIMAIAIALGLGTMVGWKRIVVTIGEKIGKSHLNYAQGASAELVAAATITVSSMFGLPVSTTHVLSSGVAGTMVADSGFKNLQTKTVTSIGIAWLITLPVTILFSGLLFLLFRMIFV
jgi:PiT family inorganic phosphate transporter